MARAETRMDPGKSRATASTADGAGNVGSHSPLIDRASNGEPAVADIESARARNRRIGLLLMTASSLLMLVLIAGVVLAFVYLR